VRATTLLTRLMGIQNTIVAGFEEEAGELVLHVHPTWQSPRCGRCGRKCDGLYDFRDGRSWRHLDFGGVRVLLRYNLRRVDCRKCGVVVERVPWSVDVDSRFTTEFEEQVAYQAQRTDKSAVEKLMGIAWRTVGRIIERVVKRLRPDDPLANLVEIGVDELSYRKQHHYISLVTDHNTGKIVWGHQGKSADSLVAFFDELGDERCKMIKVVTMDMSQAFISAVRLKCPNAQIVFDRFHVQKLVGDAVDETRREEWRRLTGTPEGGKIKKLRWVLLKNPWNLTAKERGRLATLEQDNARLYRVYLLKEELADILGGRQIHVMERRLREWLDMADASELPALMKAAKTIRTHFNDIVAYARHKLSNGLVEGLNNKARLLTRRAFGFHSAEAVIAMVMLCCTGLDLEPIRKILHL